ncbi:hypothetical protein ACFVYT_16045, partial [Streptomyces sp. NPDC058290]
MSDAAALLHPGAPDSPVILHVPHSSRAVPADVRAGILLDDRALEGELDHITDSHTAEIAARGGGGAPPPPPRGGTQRTAARSVPPRGAAPTWAWR